MTGFTAAEDKIAEIDAIADPERIRRSRRLSSPASSHTASPRRPAALPRAQNLVTRSGTMATEQSGPANLLLREPRRAGGCGPTDLDDLDATATATAAAIIRAKSAICANYNQSVTIC